MLRVESTELIQEGEAFGSELSNADSARKAWEYILSQKCIDKSIFRSDEHYEFGIGCSCSSKETPLDQSNYLCYFVLAHKVEAKRITENIPDF